MSVVMNLFAATEKVLIVCGRRKLHTCFTTRDNATNSIDLVSLLKPEDKTKSQLDKMSVVCCGLSPCSLYATVADSEKNVFTFLNEGSDWKLICTWKVEKRIIKVQFNNNSTYLVITDKTGDVYTSWIHDGGISFPKKILGHCSLILDTMVTNDNSLIYTSDRDEKIRVSLFPDAYEIHSFLLGHQEAVVNIAFVKQDKLIVSASCDGVLKIWDRESGNCITSWNVFDICKAKDNANNLDIELMRMRVANTTSKKCHLAFIIDKYPDIPILEFDSEDTDCRLHSKIKKTSEFCDAAWVDQTLYVFTPDVPMVEKYVINENESVSLCDASLSFVTADDVKNDLIDYAGFHKSYASLKKLAHVDRSIPVEPDPVRYTLAKSSRFQKLRLEATDESLEKEK